MAYAWMNSRLTRAPNTDTGADYDEEGPEPVVDEIDDIEDEGDEGEGEVDPDRSEEGEGEEATARAADDVQVRQPSRAERRVQQALREAKEAKEEIARLRAERAQPATPQQPRETEAQRAERLAMMDPEDRITYLVNERVGAMENKFAGLQFQMQESADRTAFEALCARNPVAAKLSEQVEDYLTKMRAGGTTAPRETVLRYVIGDRALANAGRATGKAARAAATNTARQSARPGSARGDAAPESRRAGADTPEGRRKRLDGVQI